MKQDLNKEEIRIGTLVDAGMDSAEYIRQIIHHGFESFGLTFWQTTNEIDWHRLSQEIMSVLDNTGILISSLGIFGNPLEETALDIETLRGWEACIDHAHLFGAEIVGGFTGRLRGQSIDKNIPRYREIFEPLAKRAQDRGVLIAFENCDMDGTWQSGDWNIAHNPVAWEMMFDALPYENIGLQWEPCHQMVSLIDPMPQLRKWLPKIFHVHGKDATINWDIIRKYGIHTTMHEDVALPSHVNPVPPFAYHRTPGFGDSNWTDIISELRKGGYKGCLDIEGWHDPVYKGELEMTGQVHALNYLKRCRGGSYTSNPQVHKDR